MSDNIISLPSFPCNDDVWTTLANETRPIVVYGMGNGADKLLDRFSKYGIEVSDFFASNGFVRGHSFRGFRVKSFSEIKEQYESFVIVISFASRRNDVIEIFEELNRNYEVYVPDMPVAKVDEYFDKDFYNLHYNEITEAYSSLRDDYSKNVFASIVKYKLTAKLDFLLSHTVEAEDIYSLLDCGSIRHAIDAGAYNGDTAIEMKRFFNSLESIIAIEPDKKNFAKLVRYSEAENDITISCINAAVWCECTELTFNTSGNRNSTISASASYQSRSECIKAISLDSLSEGKIDYVKYDVEGAESEALVGSHQLILRDRPSLLVSLYHRSRDIFEIINELKKKYPFYSFYLRRIRCVPAWEIDLIATVRN